MAGLINLRLLTDFFNKIGQSRLLSDVGMSASPSTPDVRLRRSKPTLRAMYGRRPRCKRNLTFCEAFGCSHVCGLFSREGLPPSRCGHCGRWP